MASMPPLTPPPSGGAPDWGSGYSSALPAVGLAGLTQGFAQGMSLGHDWQTQARQQDLENQRIQDSAEWRKNELAQQLALRSQQEKQQAEYHQGQIQNRQDMLQFMKNQADRVGTPIMDAQGNVIGYQTGKGGIMKPAVPKPAEANTGLDMLNSLSDSWDKLGAGDSVGGATLTGGALNVAALFPSTKAGQYSRQADLLAAQLDHDLAGRVNDVTIAKAKAAIPGFADTPESKKNNLEFIRKIYTNAGTGPAAKDVATTAAPMAGKSKEASDWNGGDIHVYSNGTKARYDSAQGKWIKID